MMQTERCLKHAAQTGLDICVVINKFDRLITELKLPPTDAYHKLCHTLTDINTVLEKVNYKTKISPRLGNVCFASSQHQWVFSLQSFAKSYADYHGTC